MTKRYKFVSLVAAPVLLLSLVFGVALAQTCASIGKVSPLNSFANIRKTPAVQSGVLPIATLTNGNSADVDLSTLGWFRLCSGGYVAGNVVSFSTNTPGATLTKTRTATATRTATVGVSVTPTQIKTSTAIPAAEQTKTAEQYQKRVCFFFPEDEGRAATCYLLPFDTLVEIDTVQAGRP